MRRFCGRKSMANGPGKPAAGDRGARLLGAAGQRHASYPAQLSAGRSTPTFTP
jgi:hypothetical protein